MTRRLSQTELIDQQSLIFYNNVRFSRAVEVKDMLKIMGITDYEGYLFDSITNLPVRPVFDEDYPVNYKRASRVFFKIETQDVIFNKYKRLICIDFISALELIKQNPTLVKVFNSGLYSPSTINAIILDLFIECSKDNPTLMNDPEFIKRFQRSILHPVGTNLILNNYFYFKYLGLDADQFKY